VCSSDLGATVIRTDVLRKELLDIPPATRHHESFGEGIYSDDISRRTYDKAYELATSQIKRGKPVIIDASFKRRREREKAMNLAKKLDVPFYVIESTCREEIVKKRLDKRMKEKDNASDGRWEIFLEQKKDFDEISELSAENHFVIDTSENQELARQEIVQKIRNLNRQLA
jgi:hypothetical protein